MRILMCLFGVFAVLALLHSTHGEFRYKIRGPPPPPLPPKPPILLSKPPPPPYYSKSKYHLSSGPRIISSHLRGPPVKHYLDHSPYHYHPSPPLHMLSKPVIHSPSAVHKSPPKIILSTGFKEPFRLPITLKESFPQTQPITIDYNTPSKTPFVPSTISPHNFPSVLLHDDEKGPIHTIPAPNLSPADKPLSNSVPNTVLSNHLDTSLTGHSLLPQQFPAFALNAIHLEQPVPVAYALNSQPSGGYQVHENTNDHTGHDLEGKPVYYAPDPDPSIPAPRVPPTSDPHSHPSNGKTKDELLLAHAHAQSVPPQIFETQTDVNSPSNSLTSQDLFHLLQGNVQQQQQLLDNYGLPVVAQPHLQQQFIHHVPAIPVYHQSAALDNSLAFKQNFQTPEFHSFNYQEKGSTSDLSGSQHYNSQLLNNFHDSDNGDDEEAESAPVPTFVKHLPNPISGYQSQQDYKSETDVSNHVTNEQQKKSVPESFFSQVAQSTQLFTTLPNREAAETLASLQAAGNINSNFVNKINEVKSEPQNTQSSDETSGEDEYSDEDTDDDYDENQTQVTQIPQHNQISAASPAFTNTRAQQQLQNTLKSTVQHNNNNNDDVENESTEQDGTEYSESEQQFGARIRPK